MAVEVRRVVRGAVVAALFGAAGASVYVVQLLLPRLAPYASGAPAVSFDGTFAAHRLARTTVLSDERRVVVIGAGSAPAVLVLGYTRCTDECPVTIAALSRALAMEDPVRRVRAYFLTTDPEHDSPAVLRRYLAAWGHRVVGVTAAPGVVRGVEAQLGAGTGARERHDARVFLVDGAGDVVGELEPPLSAAELRAALLRLPLPGRGKS